MKSNLFKNILVAGLASAAFASCAPVKTNFASLSAQYASLGAVAEFEHESESCPDGGAEGAILADGGGNSFLVRSECQNFVEPVPLNPEEVEPSPSGEEIKFREDVFEMRNEDGRSSDEAREEENAEIPQSNEEQPRQNVEVPRSSTEVPRSNTEIPKSNTEVPRPSTEVPKSSTEGRI